MGDTIPDWVKLLLGPLLALIPILVWETTLKPRRIRLSTSVMLLAEVDYVLFRVVAETEKLRVNPNTVSANVSFVMPIFDSVTASAGELPPSAVRSLTTLRYQVGTLDVSIKRLQSLMSDASKPGADLDALGRELTAATLAYTGACRHAASMAIVARDELIAVLKSDSFGDVPETESVASIRKRATDAAEKTHVAADGAPAP